MSSSSEFVVGVDCIGIKEGGADETNKTLVYRFEVTWSDESKTTKELSSECLHLFRRQLKTEIYKNHPVFPEVPDGKVSGSLVSKAKKTEKRRKAIEEFCMQVLNLPHQTGKLQAIRNLFLADQTTDGLHRKNDEGDDDDDAKVVVGSSSSSEERKRGGGGGGGGGGGRSAVQYVQLEFLDRQKSLSTTAATKTATDPIYAEVVLLRASTNAQWLTQSDEGSEEPRINNRRDSSSSSISSSSSSSYSRSDSNHLAPCPPPPPPPHSSSAPPAPPSSVQEEDAVAVVAAAGRTKVQAAKAADEMPDSHELNPRCSSSTCQPLSQSTAIFDAAMLSNFPEGTLVPLPPSFSPEQCPMSADLKLTKNAEPSNDDMHHIYVISICDWRSKGENTLTFGRGQKALLHYTSTTWWFISTRHSVGWAPAEFWRIVTDWKSVSGKPLEKFAPWNFGVFGRKECEEILRRKGNQQDFLIRQSANATGHLVLSVLHNDRVHHFEIQITDQGQLYIGHHHFQTIHNVVLYYKKRPLFTDESGNDFRLGRFFVRPET